MVTSDDEVDNRGDDDERILGFNFLRSGVRHPHPGALADAEKMTGSNGR